MALAAGDLDGASARYAAALVQHQDRPRPALVCMIASGCAKLAMGGGKPDLAARLLGVVEAMRLALGISLTPGIQTSTERCEELVSQALEEEYEAVCHVGAQLTIDQTVALIRSVPSNGASSGRCDEPIHREPGERHRSLFPRRSERRQGPSRAAPVQHPGRRL